jgi:hypothetical protein
MERNAERSSQILINSFIRNLKVKDSYYVNTNVGWKWKNALLGYQFLDKVHVISNVLKLLDLGDAFVNCQPTIEIERLKYRSIKYLQHSIF